MSAVAYWIEDAPDAVLDALADPACATAEALMEAERLRDLTANALRAAVDECQAAEAADDPDRLAAAVQALRTASLRDQAAKSAYQTVLARHRANQEQTA